MSYINNHALQLDRRTLNFAEGCYKFDKFSAVTRQQFRRDASRDVDSPLESQVSEFLHFSCSVDASELTLQ